MKSSKTVKIALISKKYVFILLITRVINDLIKVIITYYPEYSTSYRMKGLKTKVFWHKEHKYYRS